MQKKFKGNRSFTSGNSSYNALDFFIRTTLNGMINTAIPVRVESVELTEGKAGFVSVLPLIQQYDGFENVIESKIIYKLPYVRLQGGRAALIVDPKVGDVGVAIFSQQDISKLSNIPQKPASFRSFSMADGIYLGGIINDAPEVYIEIDDSGIIKIKAENKIIIESEYVEINADKVNVRGDLVAGGVSMSNHIHTNVERGSDTTGVPQK